MNSQGPGAGSGEGQGSKPGLHGLAPVFKGSLYHVREGQRVAAGMETGRVGGILCLVGETRAASGEGQRQWGRAGAGSGGELAGFANGPEASGSLGS